MERASPRAVSPYEVEFQLRLHDILAKEQGHMSAKDKGNWRKYVMQELWQESMEIAQLRRKEKLPSTAQRWQEQVSQRMFILGEEPLAEWVRHLECLVQREIMLDDSYRALWWYAVQRDPWLAEGMQPEGGAMMAQACCGRPWRRMMILAVLRCRGSGLFIITGEGCYQSSCWWS